MSVMQKFKRASAGRKGRLKVGCRSERDPSLQHFFYLYSQRGRIALNYK